MPHEESETELLQGAWDETEVLLSQADRVLKALLHCGLIQSEQLTEMGLDEDVDAIVERWREEIV